MNSPNGAAKRLPARAWRGRLLMTLPMIAVPMMALSNCMPVSLAADSAATRQLVNAAATPGDWVTHGGTYEEQRYSQLDQVNTRNVSSLGLAWSLELDTNRGQETTPLVVGGTVYLTTAWSKVVAIDGVSGKQLWQYDPQVPGAKAVDLCCDVVNRGAAYFDGKVYVGTIDGRLIALDAKTGKPVWSVNTIDPARPYTITGAPRVIKGAVVIGNGGAEMGVRGYVTAYDAMTGAKKWRFYTVPRPDGQPDGEVSDSVLQAKAQGTWFDGLWKETGGGGTVWDAIVYDPVLDQIYLGVGNGTPWNHELRSGGKGDNLFLSSIVALDASTGAYKWHYQVNPAESWDFTAAQPIILADLSIDGKPRKVLMQAPKNGFFYVLDRQTGKLISAKPFAKVTWATSIDLATGRPVEVPEARYRTAGFLMFPSAFGAHSWYPMSFSPRTGLVYLPAQDVPMFYDRDKQFKLRAGTANSGVYAADHGLPSDKAGLAAAKASLTGSLIAWDPVAQRAAWTFKQRGPGSAGTLVTAGDVVFEGTQEGQFLALDARNGSLLWSFQAQTSVGGSPITYSIGGVQYVLVVSGAGGGFGVSSPFLDDKRAKPNGRVLAFKLGGKGSLPGFTPPPLGPAVVPTDAFTSAQVTAGRRLFDLTCSFCHGGGGISSGVLPDLRRSPILADRDAWRSVVIDGVLTERGMVSFSRSMNADQAEEVRAYVSSLAHILAKDEATE